METKDWALELHPDQGERLSYMLRGEHKRPPKRVFQITKEKLKCSVCGGPHRIWNCEKLKKECTKARTEIIKTLKMRFKCLLKHQMGMCQAEDCSYCGVPHNVFICYKKENATKNKEVNYTWKAEQHSQDYQPPKQQQKKGFQQSWSLTETTIQ